MLSKCCSIMSCFQPADAQFLFKCQIKASEFQTKIGKMALLMCTRRRDQIKKVRLSCFMKHESALIKFFATFLNACAYNDNLLSL